MLKFVIVDHMAIYLFGLSFCKDERKKHLSIFFFLFNIKFYSMIETFQPLLKYLYKPDYKITYVKQININVIFQYTIINRSKNY